jgi:hypothetical protein
MGHIGACAIERFAETTGACESKRASGSRSGRTTDSRRSRTPSFRVFGRVTRTVRIGQSHAWRGSALARRGALVHDCVVSGRGTCGVFAVNSHCREEPFVRDVLLYDQLLIPVPPHDEPKEWDSWVREGWEPWDQEKLLEVLGTQDHHEPGIEPLAYTVEWSGDWRALWRENWAHRGVGDTPFSTTAKMLKVAVPTGYEAVEAVVAYQSLDEFAMKTSMQPTPTGGQHVPESLLVALIGYELLLPPPGKDSLNAAVELARDSKFRAQRQAFYEDIRQFLAPLEPRSEEQGNDAALYTDPATVRAAVERLSSQMNDYDAFLRGTTGWKRVEYAMAVLGFIATGILSFANPIALAGVFASVGQFVAANVSSTAREGNGSISGASMFVTARRELGWAQPQAR